MNEWDAMSDFLEESGHPEWAEMARERAEWARGFERQLTGNPAAAMAQARDWIQRNSVGVATPASPGTVMVLDGARYVPYRPPAPDPT